MGRSGEVAEGADRCQLVDHDRPAASVGDDVFAEAHVLGDEQAVPNFAIADLVAEAVIEVFGESLNVEADHVVRIFKHRQVHGDGGQR